MREIRTFGNSVFGRHTGRQGGCWRPSRTGGAGAVEFRGGAACQASALALLAGAKMPLPTTGEKRAWKKRRYSGS